MANSMIHWNAQQAVAFKIRYTGNDPRYYEPAQIGFLALDSNFDLRKDVMPICCNLLLSHPERWDADTANMTKKEVVASQTHAPTDPEKFKDLFHKWFEKLDVKHTKFGTQKRLMLIGHDMQLDIEFLKEIFYADTPVYFDLSQTRDTRTVALYLNDYAGMHNELIRYPKTDEEYLRHCCSVEKTGKDMISEMAATALVYQRLTRRGVFNGL